MPLPEAIGGAKGGHAALGRDARASQDANALGPAKRPLRATMDLSRLEQVYGVKPRAWQDALKEILVELKAPAPPA